MDEYCVRKTIISVASGSVVMQNSIATNITVSIARVFASTEAQTSLACGAGATRYPTSRINATTYVCTITENAPTTLALQMFIGNTPVTSNNISVTIVQPG